MWGLFNSDDCNHTFSQWKKYEGTYSRAADSPNEILAAKTDGRYYYTVLYQERVCTKCGFVEQSRLKY